MKKRKKIELFKILPQFLLNNTELHDTCFTSNLILPSLKQKEYKSSYKHSHKRVKAGKYPKNTYHISLNIL